MIANQKSLLETGYLSKLFSNPSGVCEVLYSNFPLLSTFSEQLPNQINIFDCIPCIHLLPSYQKHYYLSFQSPFSELLDYSYLNIPIGSLALRDLSLCLKSVISPHTEQGSAEDEFYRATFFSCLISIDILQTLFDLEDTSFSTTNTSLLVPDVYSLYISLDLYCKQLKIQSSIITACYVNNDHLRIIQADPRERSVAIYSSQQLRMEYDSIPNMFSFSRDWIDRVIVSCSTAQSYSVPINQDEEIESRIYDFYSKNNYKIAKYFTSSPDEEFLSRSSIYGDFPTKHLGGHSLFKTEIDFLHALLQQASHGNIALVIRLHPRLAPDKCGSVYSSSYLEMFYQTISSYSSPNILVIDPNSKISSYWLALLNGENLIYRSSMGINSSLLGATFLTPSFLDTSVDPGYPFVAGSSFHSIDHFFERLVKNINSETSSLPIWFPVRAHFIRNIADSFAYCKSPASPSYTESLYHKTCQHFNLNEALKSGSSLQMPTLNGYFKPSEYSSEALKYLSWLYNIVYSRLGMKTEDKKRLVRRHVSQIV